MPQPMTPLKQHAPNSEGVTGLHQNGDVAEWPDILEGGSFGEWLMSVEVLRNVLTPKPATDEDLP